MSLILFSFIYAVMPLSTSIGARGSLNVGKFYFQVKVDSGQIFEIYYDRAMKGVDKRKGEWFLYRELE